MFSRRFLEFCDTVDSAHYYVRVSQVSSKNVTGRVESKVVHISRGRTPAGNICTSHPVRFASPSAAKRSCLATIQLQSINVTCVSSTGRSTFGIQKFVCFCYAFRALKSSFFPPLPTHTCLGNHTIHTIRSPRQCRRYDLRVRIMNAGPNEIDLIPISTKL